MTTQNQEQSILWIPLTDIQSDGSPFDLRMGRPEVSPTVLRDSIQRYGLLTPLWVQTIPDGSDDGGYRYWLVHGFRRLTAAHSLGLEGLPAEEVSGAPADLLRKALSVNASCRTLTLLEKIAALKALESFGISDLEIVGRDLSLLGLPTASAVHRELRRLFTLEPTLLSYLSEKGCPVRRLTVFSALDRAGQSFALKLVQLFKPGLNDLETSVRLLVEIAKREQETQAAILEILKIDGAVGHAEKVGASPDQLESILRTLFLSRYLELARNRKRVSEIISWMRLPPHVRIRWDENFEKTGITLEADLKAPSDLGRLLTLLSDPSSSEMFRKVLDTLG